MYMDMGIHGGQKKVSHPFELELQMAQATQYGGSSPLQEQHARFMAGLFF